MLLGIMVIKAITVMYKVTIENKLSDDLEK
jgi:hypothetical protein